MTLFTARIKFNFLPNYFIALTFFFSRLNIKKEKEFILSFFFVCVRMVSHIRDICVFFSDKKLVRIKKGKKKEKAFGKVSFSEKATFHPRQAIRLIRIYEFWFYVGFYTYYLSILEGKKNIGCLLSLRLTDFTLSFLIFPPEKFYVFP